MRMITEKGGRHNANISSKPELLGLHPLVFSCAFFLVSTTLVDTT